MEELSEETIMGMDLNTAYQAWLMREGKEEDAELYRKARYGINIVFDIYDIQNDMLILEPQKGRYRHVAMRKLWKTNKIHTELEERLLLLRRRLIELIPEKNSTTARKL